MATFAETLDVTGFPVIFPLTCLECGATKVWADHTCESSKDGGKA